MFRKLITLLLCASAVQSAPQQNTNITDVKRQVEMEYTQPQTNISKRESRIEKVPLTIPENVTKEDKEPAKHVNKVPAQTESAPIYNYSDRIYSIKAKPKNNNSTTLKSITSDEEDNKTELNNTDQDSDIVTSETRDIDIVPAESILNDRIISEDNGLSGETGTTESDVTEKYEELTTNTEADEITTRASSPRFLPKLSYFEKSFGSFSQNLIPIPNKRRFRSRCRCEKIWNCAKLQISVPRCPEEEFMCCS